MKKDKNFIRKNADSLLQDTLRNLFYQNNMILKEHSASAGEDNGTDFYFDVTTENEEHNFFFRNQNKGTYESLPIIKNKKDANFGKISHQISLRNAVNYYNEFDEAIIFTFCDMNSKIIYWYDIQNDTFLKERILQQKNNGINSIQIYIPIGNILNGESFKNFLNEIKYSKINQIRKKKLLGGNIEADYSKTQNDNLGKHIIDQLAYSIKLFDGIKVLPTTVISQLYPFRGSENTYINDFELYTDNSEFFDFMDRLSLNNNELETQSNEIFVENQKEKLNDIISFFQVNHIRHIRWRGKSPKGQICIHNLYRYGSCDCERCNLERLNVKRTTTILNENLETSTNYEKLRRGYTYYLLGDYKNSIDIFLSIYNEADRNNDPIIYTISTYNITKLRRLIKLTYYESDRNKILKKISNIDFDIDEPLINRNAPYFLDVFRSIKEQRFFNDIRDDIENSFTEIQKLSFNDKFGSVISQNGYYKLRSTFLRFTSYLEHNFIIFNHYSEFKDLSKKVLESIFTLYTLKNPSANKYEKFDWSIIEMWIFSVDEDYSKYLLKKYNIKKITIDSELKITERLNELIENLIESNEYIGNLSNGVNPLRIDIILNKIVLITSLLDTDFKEKKGIIQNIIKLCGILKNRHIIPYNDLVKFGEANKDEIDKDLIKSIIDLFFLDEYERFGFGRLLNIYAEKSSEIEIENLIKRLLKVKKLDDIEIDSDNNYFEKVIYLFTFLNNNFKENIKAKITKKLNEEFDEELYDLAIIFELIDFDEELFQKFILTVPDMSTIEEERFSHGYFENDRLAQIMNIVFKYNLEINDEIKSLIQKSHSTYYEYYCWLIDIDNYDYVKFNPFWILKHRTEYYFNRFKKSRKLKEELSKSLKENYIEGIAKIYFEEIV